MGALHVSLCVRECFIFLGMTDDTFFQNPFYTMRNVMRNVMRTLIFWHDWSYRRVSKWAIFGGFLGNIVRNMVRNMVRTHIYVPILRTCLRGTLRKLLFLKLFERKSVISVIYEK